MNQRSEDFFAQQVTLFNTYLDSLYHAYQHELTERFVASLQQEWQAVPQSPLRGSGFVTSARRWCCHWLLLLAAWLDPDKATTPTTAAEDARRERATAVSDDSFNEHHVLETKGENQ